MTPYCVSLRSSNCLPEWIWNPRPSWFHMLPQPPSSILASSMAGHDCGSPPLENLSTCYLSKQRTPQLEAPVSDCGVCSRRWVFSLKDFSNCMGQNFKKFICYWMKRIILWILFHYEKLYSNVIQIHYTRGCVCFCALV